MNDQKIALAGAIYERLKERIMDQVYPPRERLNIDALAADLSVSPTPVREALARLSAERLVTFEAFKGYRVSPLLTSAEVAALMHVRRLIEIDAAALAAQRILIPDLIAVEKILQQILEQSASVEVGTWSHGYHQFNQLDQEFHETIIGAAGNHFLLTAHRSLNIHLELGRFYKVFREMDQQQTCVEHNAIVQALRDRNPAAAAAAVEAHLHATEERIFRLIDKYPGSFVQNNGTKSGR